MFGKTEIDTIRKYWTGRQGLLGAPDAEKDVTMWPDWESRIFLHLDRFRELKIDQPQLIVGRKGTGKSAGRLAAERDHKASPGTLPRVISASAERLVDSAINEFDVRNKMGAAAVSVWYKIFAFEFLKEVATALAGRPLVDAAEIEIRRWALSEGFAVEDFGERLIQGLQQLIPKIREHTPSPVRETKLRDQHIEEVLRDSKCTLFVDDFDNPGDNQRPERLGARTVQAAIEAADRLTASFGGPNVSLLIREDLWLRCRINWHYLDKVTSPLWLQWNAQDLRKFLKRRLIAAATRALEVDSVGRDYAFDDLWNIFFPVSVRLEDGSVSQGVTYVIRRTMYTPRDIQTFLHFALKESKGLPLSEDDFHAAEEKFSSERMQYLVNEFGTMCRDLSQCLHSFAGHSLEWNTSELRKSINGQLAQGLVRPSEAACADPSSAVDMMRFLFRIGFLEVRIPHQEGDGWEVRDGLRHPDHWSGARVDDSVRWAVRSTFFRALQAYRADHRDSIASGRKLK